MPSTSSIPVTELKLDLENFRTVPQKSESDALHAMISVRPDWFWALAQSLLVDGYLPTENIIVLKRGKELIVKEGNRRIGALKLILGLIDSNPLDVPGDVQDAISKLDGAWKKKNATVPVAIYEEAEADTVDAIVTLTHGKGEKAGRDAWNAVARARHNRDKSGNSEFGLDLLEKYLKHGQNLTPQQAERWGGDYPLSVLDEAMKRLAPRVGLTPRELASKYPFDAPKRSAFEHVLHDIGLESLGFERIRDKILDFGQPYGLDTTPKPSVAPGAQGPGGGAPGPIMPPPSPGPGVGAPVPKKIKAVPSTDKRSVMRTLRAFHPVGKGREKLATLLAEARTLKLDKQPHAFCFLLRSMFEISAKAYCSDHAGTPGSPTAIKPTGEDRTLAEILNDIERHLTKGGTDKPMVRHLHGAMAELRKPSGFLSVTSMNQLIHNSKFSVHETHISTLFGNVFPLLEAMSR